MKNITFSAQEEAIKKARQAASKRHRTLNEFDYQSTDKDIANKLEALWEQTGYL